jgi:hypothetical protein
MEFEDLCTKSGLIQLSVSGRPFGRVRRLKNSKVFLHKNSNAPIIIEPYGLEDIVSSPKVLSTELFLSSFADSIA